MDELNGDVLLYTDCLCDAIRHQAFHPLSSHNDVIIIVPIMIGADMGRILFQQHISDVGFSLNNLHFFLISVKTVARSGA